MKNSEQTPEELAEEIAYWEKIMKEEENES